jgi:nucleoid-associated protein YgaU
MARETKYGLCLIAVLCVGLVGAIVWRVSREMKQTKAEAAAEAAAVAQAVAKPPQAAPKLVLHAEDGDRAESKPPTPAVMPPKADAWARAQLASAAEPRPLPAGHRYPLMPAPADDEAPVLAANDVPATSETTAVPHTSFRPDDTAPAAATQPAAKRAAPGERFPSTARVDAAVPVTPLRETVATAAEQPNSAPRYGEPVSAPPTQAAPLDSASPYPTAEPRGWPRAGGAAVESQRRMPRAPISQVPDRGDGTAIVRPNDTFWTISERAYGTGAYFKALIHFNSEKHPQPNRLAVGDTVLTPPMAELAQKYPQHCPKPRQGGGGEVHSVAASISAAGGRRYEVRDGDTLYDIARYELGDGARWVEIYQLNKEQLTDDFHYLKTGSTLILPSRQPAKDRIAREPEPTRFR